MCPAIPKRLFVVAALLACLGGCDDGNTSSVSADYATVRVRRLVLTDESGRPLVTLGAGTTPDGRPSVVLLDADGRQVGALSLEKAVP